MESALERERPSEWMDGLINGEVPFLGGLAEAIKSTVEDTYLVFLVANNVTLRLLDIDSMMKLTIEEGRFYIKVADRPRLVSSKGDKYPKGLILCERSEGGIKIDTWTLPKTLHDESGLVSSRGTVRMQLSLIKPFGGDSLPARGQIGEVPRSVLLDRLHLAIHGCMLARVTNFGKKGHRVRV